MRIPVRVTLFDVGVGGAPTTTNPHTLARLDAVEFVTVNEGGYESLEVRFRAPTRQAARQYLTRLMANVHVDGPRGKRCWEGFVQEVAVTIDGMTTTKSMVDLANMVVVRYKSETGAQASASALTHAASIARYGTKCRLINYSTTTPAVASNRAATALAQSATPGEKRARASGSGTPEPGYVVVITCRGWWDTLGWLLTANASTASVATSTQALNLITAYNAVNPFFSTSTARVTATGLNDTSVIEDDSTYAEAIATKLASGNAAQQRVVYGCYQDRQITIRPWAKANPTTYAYQQRAGDPTIRDGYGNVVDAWDVQPDAMVLLDGVDAQYIRRVRVKLSRDAQTLELEADESEGVEELLTKPAGAGPSGTSARQAAIERTVHRQAQTRFSGTNGNVDMGGGRLSTGGGSILTGGGHIDTGGGSIDLGGGTIDTGGGSILTGGGTITYPPGGGTGATGSGTTGKLTTWSDGPAGVLADAAVSMAGAGSLVLQPEVAANLTLWGNLTAWSAGEIDLNGSYFGLNSSMTISPAGATTGQALAYNGTVWAPATIGALGGAPIGAKYIVQQSDGTLTNEQALGSLSTGILKNTTTTGVLSIAVAGTDYVAPGTLNELIDDRVAALLIAGSGISLSYNDAGDSLTIATSGLSEIIDDRIAALLVAGSGISLSYNDAANTLTISNTGGTVGGTGTAGRLMQWASGGADAENSTLIKSGAGLLTLSAAGAYTVTIDSSIRLNGAGAASGDVLTWNGTAYAPAALTAADVGAAPDNVKYIVQQATSALSAEQALGSLATGLLKNTTTTGVLSIAVAGTDYAAASHTHAASDITSGVLATARLGSGTANSTKYLAGDSTWQTLPSGVTGSAAATQVAYFSSAGVIAGNSALTFDVGAGDLFVSGIVNSNTHIEVLGTQVLGPRRTGWGGPTGTATRTTFATSTVTLSQLAERVKALIDDLSTHGAIGG